MLVIKYYAVPIMDQVFSVPVKSLVKTEESEEEGEKSPQFDLDYHEGK